MSGNTVNAFLYMQIDTVYLLFTGILFFKNLRDIDKSRPSRLYCFICFFTIGFFVTDSIWNFISQGVLSVSVAYGYLINILYFYFMALTFFFWFLYIEFSQNSWISQKRKREFWVSPPLILLLAALNFTPLTGWVFSLNENNEYFRGPLYILLVVCVCCYPAYAAITTFFKSLSKSNYYNRRFFMKLASFMVIPGIFAVLQFIAGYEFPIVGFGYVVTLFVVYIENQETKITEDKLTHLATRDQVLRVLEHKMNQRTSGKKLYLFMIDADKFKGINDKYGHVEGDEALISIAKALKAGFPNDYHLGRYGGDEFIAVGEAKDNSEIMEYIRSIDEMLLLASVNKPYDLRVSIGFTKKRDSVTDVPSFIKLADEKLYMIKESKHVAKEQHEENTKEKVAK